MCLTSLGKNLNGKKILRSKNAIENAADFYHFIISFALSK